ncbi:MAG TPA: hypothetical protein VIF63_03095, partial [Candidatus Limnocylindrales bacterium]
MALVGLFGTGPVGPKPAQAGIVINPCLVVECATLTIVMHGDGTAVLNSMKATNKSQIDGIIECHRAGGTTYGSCSHDYVIANPPTHVYLRVHAFPGSGACDSAGQNCAAERTYDVTMDNDFAQHANIVMVDPRTLTVTTSGAGKGAVTSAPVGIDCGSGGSACSMHVAHGATVKLTAATEPGSTFKGWKGACSGSLATCSVKMADDRSVEAVFAKVATPPPATPKPTA